MTEFTVFKRKIVRLGSKMDHISGNLALCRLEKNIWGYKTLQGGKKPIRKTEKKVATIFCFFFIYFWTVKFFVGGGKKISRGHQMVTLRHTNLGQDAE